MDEFTRTIAGQRLRADRLEAALAETRDELDRLRERAGLQSSCTRAPVEQKPLPFATFQEVAALNRHFLESEQIEVTSLDQFLSPEELDFLESFDPLGREKWTPSDFTAVGLAGAVGISATIFDEQIDAVVRSGLGALKHSETIRRWERQASGLPIDHTGRGFGGPGHRVRSAGHDIGQPFDALRQIRNGVFEGWEWEDGVRITRVVPGYAPHEALAEALILWLKHLASDFVTATSLPLPWWSRLYEMKSRDLRKLAHELYNPGDGFGVNLRSMLVSKAFPVITTELIIRSKLWLQNHLETSSFELSSNRRLKRDEMLFAGHAVTGAASLLKVGFVCYATSSPIVLKHLNAVSLSRAGWLGWRLAAERRRRKRPRDPNWDDLVVTSTLPWELDELEILSAPVPV